MIVSRKFNQTYMLTLREVYTGNKDAIAFAIDTLRKAIEQEVELLDTTAVLEREDIQQTENHSLCTITIDCSRTYRLVWNKRAVVSPDQIELVFKKNVEDALLAMRQFFTEDSREAFMIKTLLTKHPVRYDNKRIVELSLRPGMLLSSYFTLFDVITSSGEYISNLHVTQLKPIPPLELLASVA